MTAAKPTPLRLSGVEGVSLRAVLPADVDFHAWLLQAISESGLAVAGRLDTAPLHAKAADARDPLHQARAAEVTSLWRLVAQPAGTAAVGRA